MNEKPNTRDPADAPKSDSAIDKRHNQETPLETAARLRSELGIALPSHARKVLSRHAYDKMSGED